MINITNEEYFLEKAETYCYRLQDAIIDLTLKLPTIDTIERYLLKLEKKESIVYILGLLHKCWCYANPVYLNDVIPKELSSSQKDYVKRVESMYSRTVLKEEINKPTNPLILDYCKARTKRHELDFCSLSYSSYMNSLFNITKNICKRFDLEIVDGFIISATIKTDKSPEQLKKAFYVVAEYGCCDPSDDNLRTFISLFDSTISASTGTIEWTDTGSPKANEPSIASIYTLFETLGVEMNRRNKTIISHHFTMNTQELEPDQIKARRNNKQTKLAEAIKKVL